MKHLAKAIKLCPQNQKQNIIAFGIKKRRIVSIGYNSYIKTHPLQAKYASIVNEPQRIYLHAEIAAIINSAVKIDSLFVYRIKNGVLQNAKPCDACQTLIQELRINLIHS